MEFHTTGTVTAGLATDSRYALGMGARASHVVEALCAGAPRRARAWLRLLRRERGRPLPPWTRAHEAAALFWEGRFDRALALAAQARGDERSRLAEAVAVACLALSGRPAEARARFDAGGPGLRKWSSAYAAFDGRALEAMLLHHEGREAESRAALEQVLAHARDAPSQRLARYYLAAIAHGAAQPVEAARLLLDAARGGGDLFVAQWAEDTYAELLGAGPPGLRRQARVRRGGLGRDLAAGLRLATFRASAGARPRTTPDRALALLVFDVAWTAVLAGADYATGARFSPEGAVALLAPALCLVAPAWLATRRSAQADASTSVLGALAAAAPLPLAAHALALRLGPAAGPAEALVAVWALALTLYVLPRAAPGAGLLRGAIAALAMVAAVLAPAAIARRTPLFEEPPEEPLAGLGRGRPSTDPRELAEVLLDQAERVHAAEATLLPGRPGLEELYFVGFAGYGDQDVFRREVLYARDLFDARYDTKGRSLALSNDPATRDALPMATGPNLRHVLRAVGARMNRDEDVLFLFLSSHGDERGLSVRAPRLPVPWPTLSPRELKSALDDAGITWRILIIAGCKSGVFVEALADEHTLVATAAAPDRNSYGCARGNPFTDFGRAVFEGQLAREPAFVDGVTRAIHVIEQKDLADGQVASRPQLAVGARVRAKLAGLEARLAAPKP